MNTYSTEAIKQSLENVKADITRVKNISDELSDTINNMDKSLKNETINQSSNKLAQDILKLYDALYAVVSKINKEVDMSADELAATTAQEVDVLNS